MPDKREARKLFSKFLTDLDAGMGEIEQLTRKLYEILPATNDPKAERLMGSIEAYLGSCGANLYQARQLLTDYSSKK